MEDEKIISKTLADGKVIEASMKLKREFVDVSINPKQSLLEASEAELKKLETLDIAGISDDEKEMLDKTKADLTASIEKYRGGKIEAVLVPLKYADFQIVKNGIYEAVKTGKEYNFDNDIILRHMLREERTLTVYLSLRKKSDVSKRYYASLEDIVQETESAIEQMYSLYHNGFVLSEDERKNS